MYQISDENAERMELLELLLNFIRDSKAPNFIIGQWLNTLSIDQLENLAWQTELHTPCSMLIASEAYAAEICKLNFELTLDEMCLVYEGLKLSVASELLHRKGLIILENEHSVNPKNIFKFRLTELGLQIGRLNVH